MPAEGLVGQPRWARCLRCCKDREHREQTKKRNTESRMQNDFKQGWPEVVAKRRTEANMPGKALTIGDKQELPKHFIFVNTDKRVKTWAAASHVAIVPAHMDVKRFNPFGSSPLPPVVFKQIMDDLHLRRG